MSGAVLSQKKSHTPRGSPESLVKHSEKQGPGHSPVQGLPSGSGNACSMVPAGSLVGEAVDPLLNVLQEGEHSLPV